MTGTGIITAIIEILISALTGIGEGIGTALSSIVTSIFINSAGTGISMFGTFIVIFAAIALGFSLTRWVLNFLTSFGKKNS